MTTATRRMRNACIALAALAAAFLLTVCVSGAGHALSVSSGTYVRGIWQGMSAGKQMEDAIEEAGFLRLTKENAPTWLEGELIGADQMVSPIANGSLELLWFTRPGSTEDAEQFIEETLAAKGWQAAGFGEDGAETFVKERGECTWAMAEVAQAGDEVAIVLHIRHT